MRNGLCPFGGGRDTGLLTRRRRRLAQKDAPQKQARHGDEADDDPRVAAFVHGLLLLATISTTSAAMWR